MVQAESLDDYNDDDDDVCVYVCVHVLVNLNRVFFRHCVYSSLGKEEQVCV